jgi:hypothetical protein
MASIRTWKRILDECYAISVEMGLRERKPSPWWIWMEAVWTFVRLHIF